MLQRSLANLFMADYLRQSPAWFYSRILVGAGPMVNPRFIQKYGITHVINCADETACPEWFPRLNPSQYKCMNARDSPFVNILDWYSEFEATLHAFLKQGSGTIFIHCQCGINRSAFLALTYVCKNFGLPMEAVIQSTKRQRPVMFQNTIFMTQVNTFINGRVSSSEGTGNGNEYDQHGNIGLCTSGNGTEYSNDKGTARGAETGEGNLTVDYGINPTV
jgi:hypothetical protein